MAKKKATKKKTTTKAVARKAAAAKTNGTVDHRRQEVGQIVKNACDQLNSEGVNPRDYVEQLAWLFFLKAFDESETRREEEATFDDEPYERRLAGEYAWSSWASKTDHPDEMLEFVDRKLWIKLTSPDPKKGLGDDPMAERFRRIFDNVRNYCRRGASFARVVQQVNRLQFSSDTDVHVLSEIYEDLLKRVAADSAGYAGEFYTQRHIIRAMIEVVKPQVGEKVYDPCFGTCGFLGEAADYMVDASRNPKARSLSGRDLEKLQSGTFYGLEIKPLTYLLGTMNMILHGIESANLELGNTLEVHNQNVAEKDKYDVILSNPPYGGKMASELQTNFRVRSSKTECLFLQHIMRCLAKGGRAAVVVPEGVLNRLGPDEKVRKELIEQFNLHTVLSLPAGVFLPYTPVKTNLIFFDRPSEPVSPGQFATREIWYYDLKNDGFELKSTRKPMDGEQLSDFVQKHGDKVESKNSWSISQSTIEEQTFDLTARNPNVADSLDGRSPLEIIQTIKAKEEVIVDVLSDLESSDLEFSCVAYPECRLDSVCEIISPMVNPQDAEFAELLHVGGANIESETGRLIGLRTAKEEKLKSGKFAFDRRMVLYNKIRPYLKKVALPDFDGLCSADMYPLLPNARKLRRRFLYYLLMSPRFTQYAIEGSSRAGMPKVNRAHLFAYAFQLPPLEVQDATIKRLDTAFRTAENVRLEMLQAISESSAFQNSVLRKAFAGEL